MKFLKKIDLRFPDAKKEHEFMSIKNQTIRRDLPVYILISSLINFLDCIISLMYSHYDNRSSKSYTRENAKLCYCLRHSRLIHCLFPYLALL